jgi:predicted DNA-binding protein with PD1-like motif
MEIKPNYAIGSLGRVVAMGLPKGSDLVDGIKGFCNDNNLHHGVVLTVVGSLHKVTFSQVVSDTDPRKKELGVAFMDRKVIPGPLQILAVQGIIYETELRELVVHLHATCNDVNGHIYGGHLVDGENPVRNRVEIVIAEISGVRLTEKYDKTTGHVFSPEQL